MVLGVIFSTKLKYNEGDESKVEKGGRRRKMRAGGVQWLVHVLIERKATLKVAQVPSTKAVSPGYSSCGVVAQDRPHQHPQGVLVGTPSP